jgi:rubrerythrin
MQDGIKSITIWDSENGESRELTERHPTFDSVFICENCGLSIISPLLSQKCYVCGATVVDVTRGI